MPHFLIETTYTAPIEIIEDATPDHRAFLQKGYDEGIFLLSGPQEPRIGGIILARAKSRQELEDRMFHDPLFKSGLATYHYIEFKPVLFQSFLKNWVA